MAPPGGTLTRSNDRRMRPQLGTVCGRVALPSSFILPNTRRRCIDDGPYARAASPPAAVCDGRRRRRRVAIAGTGATMAAAGAHHALPAPRTTHAASEALGTTVTPIKHVIVIIGENHTFDNVFATYVPPAGQHVLNLLSEGIVTASGAPGPDVAQGRTAAGDGSVGLPDRPAGHGPVRDAATAEHDVCVKGVQRTGSGRTRRALPGRPSERALPDHQVRSVLRRSRGVCAVRHLRVQRCVRRRSAAPLLPDVPGDLERRERPLDLGP